MCNFLKKIFFKEMLFYSFLHEFIYYDKQLLFFFSKKLSSCKKSYHFFKKKKAKPNTNSEKMIKKKLYGIKTFFKPKKTIMRNNLVI